RVGMQNTVGTAARRSMPHHTRQRLDHWFAKRAVAGIGDPGLSRTSATRRSPGVTDSGYSRGRVILWDDTFVRYYEPHIGIATVKVLEALSFEVTFVKNRRCCGRPAFSQGNLEAAAKLAKHNVDLLSSLQYSPGRRSLGEGGTTPILFLEPSCWSMFVEDYRELKIENADNIAARCFLFEKFVDDLLEQQPGTIRFNTRAANVAIHPH